MNSRRPGTRDTLDAIAQDHSALAPVTAPVKKSKTPSCVVPNCGRRLRSKYEQRCRLCMTHLKAPQVAMPEGISRWCQKCGRFQPLGEFDDERRSCRISLLRHMEKQRMARSARSGYGTATASDSLAAHVSPFAIAAAEAGGFADDATSESLMSPNGVIFAAADTMTATTGTVTTATVSTDPANGNGNGNGTDPDEHANIRSHFLSVVLEQAGWADTSFNAHVADLPPVLTLPEGFSRRT